MLIINFMMTKRSKQRKKKITARRNKFVGNFAKTQPARDALTCYQF